MERQIGIWLNSTKAILVEMANGSETVRTIESEVESRTRYPGEGKNFSRLGSMQVNPSKKNTNRKKHQLHHYFDEIIDELEGAENIFIFGPSTTKNLLEKEIRKNSSFINKNISIENSDKMTQNQLIAKVKTHFSS